MPDITYIKGRLEGLFELVSLLREVLQEEGSESKIVQRLVEHIYAEVEEILDALGSHPSVPSEKVQLLKQKIREAKTKDEKEKIVKSYDVLSELLKQQQG